MESAFGPLLSLLFVLALIPLALWLLRRTPVGGAGQGQSGRTVGVLPLSNSQRVVTVEVGTGVDRRWLVLGVTPAAISTLHVMNPQGEAPAPAQPAAFGEMIGRLRGRKD